MVSQLMWHLRVLERICMLYLLYPQDWRRISMYLELLEQSGLYRKYILDRSESIKHFS